VSLPIILPGEEEVVLTKEIFVFRVQKPDLWDPFALLWVLSLKAVREQWRRITLMQTNREDCGERYKEIILPCPPNRAAAESRSSAFRKYFRTIAEAKTAFAASIASDGMEYIATVLGRRGTPGHDDVHHQTEDEEAAGAE
jgi:type I restriction enzyme M protein